MENAKERTENNLTGFKLTDNRRMCREQPQLLGEYVDPT